jgi:hypothetical protein
MKDPGLGYWRWFYSWSAQTGQADPSDYLQVFIRGDNDPAWIPVETVQGAPNTWTEHDVRVKDFTTPSPHVQLRFVAADLGDPTIVEAAVDDITAYDAEPGNVTTPPPNPTTLRFESPRPNPFSGSVDFRLELPARGPVAADVYDLNGRWVARLARTDAGPGWLAFGWDGLESSGHPAGPAIYYVRARTVAGETVTRVVKLK